MSTHCGKLQLERYFGGELLPDEKASVELHLKECADCNAQIAALQKSKVAFLEQHPFSTFTRAHAPVVKAPWYTTLWQIACKPVLYPAYGALLVAIAVVPVITKNSSNDSTSITRFKGNSVLTYVAERNGKQFPVSANDIFVAGDKIQILFTTAKPVQLSLLSIDASGTISFYNPSAASDLSSVPVASGTNQPFPASIELDNAEGNELVIALFTESSLDKAKVKDWLSALFKMHPELPELEKSLAATNVLQADIKTLLLHKE